MMDYSKILSVLMRLQLLNTWRKRAPTVHVCSAREWN